MIDIDFDKELVPAVSQDVETNEVVMLAYMNEEAFEKTKKTDIAHYYSRSRDEIWKKGETSGNIQRVKEILVDCDADSLLLKIEQEGGACHTGYYSCFYRTIEGKTVSEKVFEPEEVY